MRSADRGEAQCFRRRRAAVRRAAVGRLHDGSAAGRTGWPAPTSPSASMRSISACGDLFGNAHAAMEMARRDLAVAGHDRDARPHRSPPARAASAAPRASSAVGHLAACTLGRRRSAGRADLDVAAARPARAALPRRARSPRRRRRRHARAGAGPAPEVSSMSPWPSSCSAPGSLMMVRLSILEATRKLMRTGKLALMVPVTTSTEGRCVAITRWMPAARAFCARRCTSASTRLPGGDHQVGELVDDDDDVGHRRRRRAAGARRSRGRCAGSKPVCTVRVRPAPSVSARCGPWH